MCGFSGLFKLNDVVSPTWCSRQEILDDLGNSIIHRGRDGVGYYVDDYASLVHRRLKIRGGDHGNQPIFIKNGRYVMCFNGEIYNTNELLDKLKSFGVSVTSSSDTLIALNVLEKFGLDGISLLEGTFAIVLYDKVNRSLSLFRDRLGVKPLYYTLRDGVVLFSSELRGLVAGKVNLSQINLGVLNEYLWFGNSLSDESFYKNIKSIGPGCLITFEFDSSIMPSQYRWWDLLNEFNLARESQSLISSNYLREIVEESCQRQLVSDLPVSLFVSGGVDSGIMAASVGSSSNVQCVTAIFEDQMVSEVDVAKVTANLAGLRHSTIKIPSSAASEDISDLLQVFGEPFGDAAAVPLYRMCRSLRSEGHKVVLQGDGGDELFLGYPRYSYSNSSVLRSISLLPQVVLRRAITSSDNISRIARFGGIFSESDKSKQWALMLTRESNLNDPRRVFRDDFNRYLSDEYSPYDTYQKQWNRFSSVDDLNDRRMLVDLSVQLPSQFLPKVDRASMLAGVEARVPLLDEKVIRIALSITSSDKLKSGHSKQVLREAFNSNLRHIPRRKVGFSTPYENWMRGSLECELNELVLDSKFIQDFNLDRNKVEQLLKDFSDRKANVGFLLWKLYMLSKWYLSL